MKMLKLDSDIVNFIDNNPASTKSKAVHGITGHDDKSLLARIDDLIEDGILENQGNNRSYILYLTDEGRTKFGRPNAVIFQLPSSK
jgi:predicted HTH transcriptional regulator